MLCICEVKNHVFPIYIYIYIYELMLNPDKSTSTLFTSCTREQDVTLNLTINNIIIPTVKTPKILGLTLDPSLSFREHTRITKEKADSSIKILKALTSTSWGKQKETLLATYKTITRPIIEYASTVWSPILSSTNLQDLQFIQNNALRVITGCTSDTNTQHLHTETKTLPLMNHLRLHASQLRQKAKLPMHPLHELVKQANCPRRMKPTIFDKWSGKTININVTTSPTPDTISSTLKTIHTTAVKECLDSHRPNSILSQPAPDISKSEETLSRKIRRTLAQLCAGKSSVLMAYLNAIDPKSYPSPACPLCNSQKHTTQHLFSCPKMNTTLTIQDLWNNPVAVAALLQQWYDGQSAAGGGPGSFELRLDGQHRLRYIYI